MKIPANQVAAFLRRPDPRFRAVLVYGPDIGLVRERAATLARTVVADLSDPFRVVTLTAEAVAKDPALLVDEAAALALTGGRRVIRVRDGSDALTEAARLVLETAAQTDSLVVVEAGDLGNRSRLRLLFEEAERGAALPCYVEDERDLATTVTELLAAHGKTISPDARDLLAASLVGDRMMARSEIDKLVTYLGDAPRVELEDVRACIGDSASLDLDDPAWAAAQGDYAALDRALGRLFGEGVSPVAVLRAAQRHFQRLHLAAAHLARGDSVGRAMAALRPPVFFKMRAVFQRQLQHWPVAALAQALERLFEAEAACKRTGAPDQALCARTLFQLAAMARAARPGPR